MVLIEPGVLRRHRRVGECTRNDGIASVQRSMRRLRATREGLAEGVVGGLGGWLWALSLVGCVTGEETTARADARAQAGADAARDGAPDAQRDASGERESIGPADGAAEAGPDAGGARDASVIDVPIGPDPDARDATVPADRCAPREVCNDRDDTCDGVVDEGCPRAIMVSIPPRFGPLSRGSASGNRAQSVAARDEVIVGWYGRKGGVIDALGTLVAPLSLVADTTREPFAYAVRTGTINELPLYGGSGGSGFREACPMDTILTSVRVVHRTGCTSPGICYEVVGDLIGQCARVLVQLEGTAWTVQFSPVSELRVMGSDAPRSEFVAPPGPWAGLWLRTGAFVDELSLGQVELTLARR